MTTRAIALLNRTSEPPAAPTILTPDDSDGQLVVDPTG
jgi:hypothetical protein